MPNAKKHPYATTRTDCLQLNDWQTPASQYPRGKTGRATIATYTYRKGLWRAYGMGGYEYFEAMKPLAITNLRIAGKTIMVDDPPHWWAMLDHATHYHGHVLVAGLGLGLIVHALNANEDVERITVVEEEADVVRAVAPHLLTGKLRIVPGDFFNVDYDFQPDGVFFDLFVGKADDFHSAAITLSFAMRRQFPTAKVVRIHGFDNNALTELTAAAQAIQGVLGE